MLVMNWAVLTLICFVSVKCYENQTLQEDDNKVIGGKSLEAYLVSLQPFIENIQLSVFD